MILELMQKLTFPFGRIVMAGKEEEQARAQLCKAEIQLSLDKLVKQQTCLLTVIHSYLFYIKLLRVLNILHMITEILGSDN